MSMIKSIARMAPPGFVRWVGRLQFRFPVLAPLINRVGAQASAGENVMRHGIGRGLKFDSQGGHPGYAMGTSDPEEQAALAQHLKLGQVFYDIGANVGFFTTLAGRIVGPAGRVYGFEPFPGSAAAARANASRNGFDHVEIIDAAVSNFEGEAAFDVSKTITVFRLLKPGESGGGDGKSIRVPVITIDAEVARGRLQPPDMVMIDVEGAELEVLEGMRQTLRARRPTIICEVHWAVPEEFLARFRAIAGDDAYDVRTLDGSPMPTGAERFHLLMTPKPGDENMGRP
ncbi:MAG TPA: FkbM family methyltransferase [Tepidisphaeraceae bacterium]|jgi:FkbM family methyltransferase